MKLMKQTATDSSDPPEISQDEHSHYERSQRDGVAHGVDEVQTVKDILLEEIHWLEQ